MMTVAARRTVIGMFPIRIIRDWKGVRRFLETGLWSIGNAVIVVEHNLDGRFLKPALERAAVTA